MTRRDKELHITEGQKQKATRSLGAVGAETMLKYHMQLQKNSIDVENHTIKIFLCIFRPFGLL